jgi:hypothetical protein
MAGMGGKQTFANVDLQGFLGEQQELAFAFCPVPAASPFTI